MSPLHSTYPRIKVEVTIKGLNQYTSKLEPEVLFASAEASLRETLEELTDTARKLTPIASGDTMEGITYSMSGSSIGNLEGRVYSPDGHFAVLEYGRRPGAKMPPERPIADWMEVVGIDVTRSSLYLIRRAIARRGLPAHYILRRALERQREHFRTVFMKRWIEDWARRA